MNTQGSLYGGKSSRMKIYYSIDHPSHQHPKKGTSSRRKFLSLSIPPILFIPWRGCSQGGFYDIGITENCQKMYQPAAAAEERLRKQLASQQQQISSTTTFNDDESIPQIDSRQMKNEFDTLLKEQKDYDKVALDEERLKQTRKLVENMWQSLE